MKRILIVLAALGLFGVPLLLTGCGNTQSSLTPQEKAQFGHPGMPMPQAAKDYMAQHNLGGPPTAKKQ